MAASNVLDPQAEFERFLYAFVGEDRSGTAVTVLSMLARLDVDPWDEIAELVALKQEAASARLERLLSTFRDVPGLERNRGSVARELSLLLPKTPLPRSPSARKKAMAAKKRPMSRGTVWTILAILVLFVAIQILFAGIPGVGE